MLRIGEISRFSDNEISPGYLNQVREMLKLSDHLITLSNFELNGLKALVSQLPPYSLVRNAAENTQVSGVTGELFASTYGVRDYVLCVGRIERRKNQLMLLHALEGIDIPLVLIGNCVEPDYEELIRRKAGSNVILVGYLPHDSKLLESAFAGARVFVLPSWSEGAPLSALEAAAAGISLVLSNRSSEREYFGDYARYCDPGCSESIRASVLEAFVKYNDEEMHRKLLQKKVFSEYSWETAATGTLQSYQQALENFKRARTERSCATSAESSLASIGPRKLEIGSGMNPHPGYEHMDVRPDLPHVEHVHDIYKPLPFAEGSFDEILSWSVVEHISWRNIREVISNWKDVLKPGGKLELWVPDLEYLCTMYKEGQADEHLEKGYIQAAQRALGHYSPAVWAMIKMYGGQDYRENFHSAMYDWDTMNKVLSTIGFHHIERIAPYYGLHIIALKAD
jgi:predicted SAM-dependent methyltransferase